MIQSTSICFAKNFVRHGYDILLAQMSRTFEILQACEANIVLFRFVIVAVFIVFVFAAANKQLVIYVLYNILFYILLITFFMIGVIL